MKIYSFLCCILSSLYCIEGYYVTLMQNGPIVIGSTITLIAELFEDNGNHPSGTFRYDWQDNAIPHHSAKYEGSFVRSVWNITYQPKTYNPGSYEVEVRVSKIITSYINWKIASERVNVNITALLNGELELIQNGTIRGNDDVSNSQVVTQRIALAPPDADMIRMSGRTAKAYWFVDCVYMGVSEELVLNQNYSGEGEHNVRALVVVEPPPPPTTTTPATTTTIATTITTSVATTTTPSPGKTTVTTPLTSTTPSTLLDSNDVSSPPPPHCPNDSFVPTDPDKTYGYFRRHINVKSPVKNVTVDGPNWLQHGDMLNLTASCSGSPPYYHCVQIMTGIYNVTGQEACIKAIVTKDCYIKILHYFQLPQTYTLLFVISNSVSKVVTPFGLNIYEVQKHAELSVIVVPISCSVVAVVLIVFGVAYYLQSRSSYMVEVADFDFSQGGGNETEYKTFKERLREAVSGALTRGGSDYSDEGPGVWSPSRKYGSMQ